MRWGDAFAPVGLWTTFAQPPWEAHVDDEIVLIDVMGAKKTRRMSDGFVIDDV